MRSALFAFCLMVPLLVACTPSFIPIEDAGVEGLHSYLQQHGGFFEWVLGKACENCARGVFAAKDYKEADTIAIIPLPSGINLGDLESDQITPVMERLLLDEKWKKTYDPYWASLPGADDMMCLETFTMPQVKLLQTPVLDNVVKAYQEYASSVFYNKGGSLDQIHNASNGTVTPAFALFNYVGGIITTRAFHFTDPATGNDSCYLLPSIDLINHSIERANVERDQEGWQIHVRATRAIKAGEELFHEYDPNVMHRPDMSLMIYGFVADDKEVPLLAAVDRADFNSDDPFGKTPTTDEISQVEDVAAEVARVEALLEQAETASSLAADQQLLADLLAGKKPPGTAGWTWKETEIIKYRVARKEGLRSWLWRLQRHLAAGGGKAAADEAKVEL